MNWNDVTSFLESEGALFDVRSPKEFAKGHIPQAISLPLFSDQERHAVGLTYKTLGKERAIDLGLKLVGPKLYDFVQQAKSAHSSAKVHCWRGGMRSASMAWLLSTAGMKTDTLKGGYKRYRKWAHSLFNKKFSLIILGGLTGSGKTHILHALKEMDQQIIDLEALTCHRGSSYGGIGNSSQPTQEQFENNLADQLHRLSADRPVWIEDESRLIGRLKIPDPFFVSMRSSPIVQIMRPDAERFGLLLKDYGSLPIQELVEATKRLHKQLGGSTTQQALAAIESGDVLKAISLVLTYYDKTYNYGLSTKTQTIYPLSYEGFSYLDWAKNILEKMNSLLQ